MNPISRFEKLTRVHHSSSIALSRLYVETAVWIFIAELTECLKEVQHSMKPSGIGPQADAAQMATVVKYLEIGWVPPIKLRLVTGN